MMFKICIILICLKLIQFVFGQGETILKLRCDERFTHAFTSYGCVFKEITLVDSSKGNYFENATACSKRMRKTLVATQLYAHLKIFNEKKLLLLKHVIFFN